MYSIAPSIGCADLLHLADQVKVLDEIGVDWLHMDIMDGSFVPNFCLGTDLIRAVSKISESPIYAHVMAVHPERHVALLKSCGVDYMTFHLETTNSPFRLAKQIHEEGMKAGIAINPSTPVELLEPLLDSIDVITLMTIEPGIVGPEFMEMSFARIQRLHEMIVKNKQNVLLEIDGGVNLINARKCLDCGADVLVAGIHAIFRKTSKTLAEQCKEFKKALRL